MKSESTVNPFLIRLFGGCAECAVQCIKELVHVCTLNSHLPFPRMLWTHHTSATPTGPAPTARTQGFSPGLSAHRLWVSELAAVLDGVLVSSFLPFSVSQEEIQSAFNLLKILEASHMIGHGKL